MSIWSENGKTQKELLPDGGKKEEKYFCPSIDFIVVHRWGWGYN